MRKKSQYRGFSLTEVLLAVGALAVGLLFIGGTFLAGIYFTTIATERTIAAVVADEAFAKIRLYGVDANSTSLVNNQLISFEDVVLRPIGSNEFAYPSTNVGTSQKKYFWSALCRLTEPRTVDNPNPSVQVTVFVSRKADAPTSYQSGVGRPVSMPVGISGTAGGNLLTVEEPDKRTWINDGYTIVENTTGGIYRVLERDADQPDTVLIDRPWNSDNIYPDPDVIWVVPPPIGGGRNPSIAVYQRIIKFYQESS